MRFRKGLTRLVQIAAVTSTFAGCGGASGDAVVVRCDGASGLVAPLHTCSSNEPCKGLAGKTIVEPLTLPKCASGAHGRRGHFNDSPPLAWTDRGGAARAACVYRPPSASRANPVPLLIYLHGAHSSADSVYENTSLRQKATSFDLGGAGRPGFVLAAEQGRNLAWPNQNGSGPHHDVYYRRTDPRAAADENPDVRSLDHLVDTLVAEGIVDPKRIYVTGWSNGAFFGQLYAIARHDVPTPGGNRIAAAAVYDGGDPYATTRDDASPTCQARSYPTTTVPIYLLHRACSIVSCDDDQRKHLGMPPGFDVEGWARTLRGPMGDPNVTDVLLDYKAAQTSSCTAAPPCGKVIASANHIRWPDGVGVAAERDWELEMLAFFAAHPLP